jgi:hypothetical protein
LEADSNGIGFTSPALLSETFSAMSALSPRQVHISVNAHQVRFTASVIEQLGRAPGASLKHLEIFGGQLPSDFWPAVWAHLPGLQQLTLGPYVDPLTSEHLVSFCSSATRPLQLGLRLEQAQLDQVGPTSRLEEACRVKGVPQVTVKVLEVEDV